MLKMKSCAKKNNKDGSLGKIKRLRDEVVGLKKELSDKEWVRQKTNNCIKVLYTELEKKNKQLEKSDQLKSQFVANVSHEFKNPLATIKESLSIILDGLAGEITSEQKKFLKIGRDSINRLIRLVTNLLNVSRIESGKVLMTREEFSVGLLVEEVLTSCKRSISKKHIIIEKNTSLSMDLIWADRDMMFEVVTNLLTNAMKYTPERGKVAIKLKGNKEWIRFEISDTGPGVPKEYHQKIFDKFERITAEKQEGTGLGLPIVKDIVGLHKGRVWLESEVGKGSKFIFVLPRNLRE